MERRSISKFHKLAGIILTTTTLAVGADIFVGSQLPSSNIEPVYDAFHLKLKDKSNGVVAKLNIKSDQSLDSTSPELSPDGLKIAFNNHYVEGGYVISTFSIVNSDGSGLVNFINDDVRDPSWIDNDTVGYVKSLFTNSIFTMKTDGSERREIKIPINNLRIVTSFCFDRKTNRIVFGGEFKQNKTDTLNEYSIYSVKLDGSDPQKIKTIDIGKESYIYDMSLTDGSQILFSLISNNLGQHAYTLNIDGSNLQETK